MLYCKYKVTQNQVTVDGSTSDRTWWFNDNSDALCPLYGCTMCMDKKGKNKSVVRRTHLTDGTACYATRPLSNFCSTTQLHNLRTVGKFSRNGPMGMCTQSTYDLEISAKPAKNFQRKLETPRAMKFYNPTNKNCLIPFLQYVALWLVRYCLDALIGLLQCLYG